jgi:ABC-type sulfate/molybdate transport systems ATPase subunit
MRIAVEQRLGNLLLSVGFELTAPWTVLFGPSGAGKTSLLRMIGGLKEPLHQAKKGEVVFRGRTFVDLQRGVWIPPAERRLGFVTQRPALFPHLDVAANVGFGLHGLSRHASHERISAMLRLFAIEPLAARKPAALSGGEKQRVALARALAPEPQMLLLDEPFTGLDAALKESILGDLTGWLRQRNIPALYVSHDVAEAFQTGADVIVLRDGRVQAQGAPNVVLAGERERLLGYLDSRSNRSWPASASATVSESPAGPRDKQSTQ